MNIFSQITNQLTWFQYAELSISDSKGPENAMLESSITNKHAQKTAREMKKKKAAHILFLNLCILKAWMLRKCRLETGTDWRHNPHHQFASDSIYNSCKSRTLQMQQDRAFKLRKPQKKIR